MNYQLSIMLLTLRHLNVRAELRLALLAAAESCWFYVIVLVVASNAGMERQVSALGIFLVYWAGLITGRVVPRIRATWRLLQLLTVLIAVIAILAALRIGLYPDVNIADMSWLPTFVGRFTSFFEQITPEFLSTLVLILAFMRALNFAQHPLTLWVVGFQFRLGTVIFFALAVLTTLGARVEFRAPIFAFFAFSLLGIALARIEDAGRTGPLGGRWAAVLLSMLTLVILVGFGVSQFFTLETLGVFFGLLSPLTIVLQVILTIISIPIFYLLEIIFAFLTPFFDLLANVFSNLFPVQPPSDDTLSPALEAVTEQLGNLMPYLRLAGIFLLVVLLGWMVARALNKRMNRIEQEMMTRESFEPTEETRKEKLPAASSRPPLREINAETIRRIYAALQAQAESLGLGRREAETPLEYLPRLTTRFPDVAPALQSITNAYVAVHYAQESPDEATVKQLRAVWKETKHEMQSKGK